jgi:hypothetical protein
MKTVTPQKISDILEDILADERKRAQLKDQHIISVPQSAVLDELNSRIGDNWQLVRQSIQFTKDDILAVAKARFYKKKGMSIILFMFAALIGVQMLELLFLIPQYYIYTLDLVIILCFLYYFAREQKKACVETMAGTIK